MDATYDFNHPEEQHEYLLDLIERGYEDKAKIQELISWLQVLEPRGDLTTEVIEAAITPLVDLLNKFREVEDVLHRAAVHIQALNLD